PDPQFNQRWSAIQANLSNQNLASANGSIYQNGPIGRVYQDGSINSGSYPSAGHFRWQGMVDGLDNISLQGSRVSINHLQSAPIQQATFNLSVPLPRRPVNLTLTRVRGRVNI